MRHPHRCRKGRRKAPFFAACSQALLLLATLGAWPAAAGNGAEPPPSPTRPGVVGADDRVVLDPTAWPWTALGRVNRDDGGFCTGALVARAIVLTADHCLYHQVSGRLLAPHRVHFLAGLRRDAWRAHARGRSYVRPAGAPEMRRPPAGPDADDWALIVLERPIDGRPLPVRRLAPGDGASAAAAPRRVARAGYGYDRPYLLSLDSDCAVTPDPGLPGVLRHTCDAVPGDSGSPLLMESADGYAVIGVTSGFARRAGTTHGFAVATDVIIEALEALARTADGTPR